MWADCLTIAFKSEAVTDSVFSSGKERLIPIPNTGLMKPRSVQLALPECYQFVSVNHQVIRPFDLNRPGSNCKYVSTRDVTAESGQRTTEGSWS